MTATETAVIEKQPVDTIVPDYFSKTRRKTLFRDEPKERQLGPHGSSSSFLNSQGLRIASYYWPVWSSTAPFCIAFVPLVFSCIYIFSVKWSILRLTSTSHCRQTAR